MFCGVFITSGLYQLRSQSSKVIRCAVAFPGNVCPFCMRELEEADFSGLHQKVLDAQLPESRVPSPITDFTFVVSLEFDMSRGREREAAQANTNRSATWVTCVQIIPYIVP